MIFVQLQYQLNMLQNLLTQLNNSEYSMKFEALFNASIGDHTRHIIELLSCAIDGYDTGLIDYFNRSRNITIAADIHLAQTMLSAVLKSCIKPDRMLLIQFEDDATIQNKVSSTYYREMVYNTEHIIHHLALIKVAIYFIGNINVHSDFGMAYATIRYNEKKE